MKFLILSSLLALAMGSNDVAPRELAITEQYNVYQAAVTTASGQPPFTIVYSHQDQTGAPSATVATAYYFEGACDDITDFSTSAAIDGVTDDSATSLAGGITGTSTTLEVDVTPKAANAVYDDGDVEVQHFCVMLGLGEDAVATNAIGYFLVDIEATFRFVTEWTCIDFNTKAYATKCKSTDQTISAKATICHSGVIRPGIPVCIEVCVDDDDFKIDSIDALRITETCDPCKIEDGKDLSTFPGYIESDHTDWGTLGYAGAIDVKCMRATFLLTLGYFSNPKATEDWGLIGDAPINLADRRRLATCDTLAADAGCSGSEEFDDSVDVCACVDAHCKANHDEEPVNGNARRLQEGGSIAQVSTKIPLELDYSGEESSARGVVAGAAAAAAFGAALLI